ncbi:MAG: DUF2779 domain-containing protein [Patescibacteria group bacterium]
MILSKTDYILFRDCPKNSWYKIHQPEIYRTQELSAFDQSLIETGNEVEIEARKLFPGGTLIEERGQAAIAITQDLLAQNTPVIFQATFASKYYAAIDVLQKTSTGYNIIEIKATNEIKDKTHLYDLAFQTILLRSLGLKVEQVYLLHLNKDYVRDGELDYTQLFKTEDVTELVEKLIPEVELEMQTAYDYLLPEDEPQGPCDCIYKGRSSHCITFHISNPHIPEYSVHDIARIGLSKKKLTELIDSGFYSLEDIPDEFELSDIQSNQVNTYKTKRPIIDLDNIHKELDGLSYPLYFIDYETFPAAIPRFDGFSPYQQIPFQWSLHIVEGPGQKPSHHEFIHTDSTDPSLDFVSQMQQVIKEQGSIIVWNKKFECKINDELATRLPQFKAFIDNVNSRVYDLMDIFHKQYYVHPKFKGSTSIKYVLPVMADELDYKKLNIQEGGTASLSWNKITTGNPTSAEKDQITKDLLTYCELDTFAMYRIWEELHNL